jgi:hypothetical protein
VSFFDRKEQVLDLQMTQHGKRLLSRGEFKPTYYEFYDNDILYDSGYVSGSEAQNDITSRIIETPRLSTQYNFEGVESQIGRDLDRSERWIRPETELHRAFKYPLGTSSPQSDKLPAWNVAFIDGTMTTASYYTEATPEDYTFIPQLTATITYDVKVKHRPRQVVNTRDETELEKRANNELPPGWDNTEDIIDIEDALRIVHPDGSYVDVDAKDILLQISENNVAFSKENFEMEVFEILPFNNGTSNEELYQLAFSEGDDDLFSLGHSDAGAGTTVDDVEYFLSCEVDDEIDPDLLTGRVTENVGNIYLDQGLLRNDRRIAANKARRDIYESPIDPTEHCE